MISAPAPARAVCEQLPPPLAIQPEECDVLEPRDRLTVSQWAAQKRRLSAKTSDLSGDWDNSRTPFLVEIMDSLSSPGIQQVTVCKCAQSGGTETALNFLGWAVDESPGPLLMVMPIRDDVVRRIGTRVRPMFESTPSLLAHVGGDLDAINIGKETELDSMILYIGWSTSPGALADNPVCYVILDEVGKFPRRSGDEADPVSLARQRMRTFASRATLLVNSTPVLAGDLIDREYQRGDRRRWWVPCGRCGEYHVMAWPNVSLDRDAEHLFLPADDYLQGRRARYVCPACGACWSESDRWRAVTAGLWAPAVCTVDRSGSIVGDEKPTAHRSYHITSLMLHPHFMTIGRLAAAWVAAQAEYRAGDIGPLQDFMNSELAQPWSETVEPVEADVLDSHVSSYAMGLVPPGVQMITIGFDVQIDHVWSMVVGWGWLGECWIIDARRVETGSTEHVENFDPLADLLRMTWPMADDPAMIVRCRKAAIDCAYRPEAVKAWCRKLGDVDVIPVRGESSVKNLIRMVKESGPSAGDPLSKIPGATQRRWDVNVDAYKDLLARLIAQKTPGPGYLHLPADSPTWLAEQLTAERCETIRNSRGKMLGHRWAPRHDRIDNHMIDCWNYARVAADLAGVRLIRNPDAPPSAASRTGGGVIEKYRR